MVTLRSRHLVCPFEPPSRTVTGTRRHQDRQASRCVSKAEQRRTHHAQTVATGSPAVPLEWDNWDILGHVCDSP